MLRPKPVDHMHPLGRDPAQPIAGRRAKDRNPPFAGQRDGTALQSELKPRDHWPGLFFFHGALQRMLVAPGEIHHLPHLCLGDLEREHPHNRNALFMHRQHQLERMGMAHAKEPLEHMDDKLHGRVVIVQKKHLIERRPLGLGPGIGHYPAVAIALIVLAGHHEGLEGQDALPHRLGDLVHAETDYIISRKPVKRGTHGRRRGFEGRVVTNLTTIGFDADDTLWQNEHFFQMTQARFAELLGEYADPDHLNERLLEAEKRNIQHYGFGIKGFVLSMIETAIEITEDRVPARIIRKIIEAGQEMLQHPIELLPHAEDAVTAMAESHRVVLITKGDLLDQERKLAQSGLGELFHGVEIVSNKTAPVYGEIFSRLGDGPERSMMVGNSLKSDVIPALEAGGWGVYVPHDLAWALEHAETPSAHERYRALEDLGGLQDLVATVDN